MSLICYICATVTVLVALAPLGVLAIEALLLSARHTKGLTRADQ